MMLAVRLYKSLLWYENDEPLVLKTDNFDSLGGRLCRGGVGLKSLILDLILSPFIVDCFVIFGGTVKISVCQIENACTVVFAFKA